MNFSFDVAAFATLAFAILWKYVADSRRNERNDHRIEVMEKQVTTLQTSLEDLKKVVHQEQLDTRKAINDGLNHIQDSLKEFAVQMAHVKAKTSTRGVKADA